ncbi:hypothetical protein OSB04_005013 [Centaurea solstitialis]|uniref:Uncharacterized protein n=1 Tax=Centaurea solstitialis TaxID=347529 RepID=A0AA38TZU5_9ASTR|nr:hypothetical protein OSB04_005013 [Centaurea solstitialis]
MCQSLISSSRNVGVSKTCNFGDGDDGDLMRFSSSRELRFYLFLLCFLARFSFFLSLDMDTFVDFIIPTLCVLYCRTELKEMLDCIPQDMRSRLDRWIRMFVRYPRHFAQTNPWQLLTAKRGSLRNEARNRSIDNKMSLSGKNQNKNYTVNAEQQNLLSLIKENFGLDLLTSLTGNFGCTASTSGSQALQLQFLNGISTPVSTGMDIKGEDRKPFTIALVDGTGEIVKTGAGAAAKVEIVALEGDCNDDEAENWSSHEFNNKIICDWNGKKVLQGNTFLNLEKGVGSVDKISFTHNSTWKKKRNCRLGARCVNGIFATEAKTESFLVRDKRKHSNEKHDIPYLQDAVWRLYKIGKKGNLTKSLTQAKIKTVGDFIARLYLNRQSLEEIFDREKHAKSLKIAEKHALTCPTKLKYCSSCEQKPEVVFNVSSEEDAKKLVISAFKNWGDVRSVDEDKSMADCSNPAVYGPAKTEMVTPCLNTLVTTYDKNIYRIGLDLHINELSLFGNMLSDEKIPNPDLLPESLRKRYHEIYSGFEKKFCRRWRMLVWVVTFTRPLRKRSLDDIRSPKKPRLS